MADLRPPVLLLMGPTASGKTALAVELVQRWPFEIISVDSALVYRGMDIGTAKPDIETQRIAPHRLINILDPAEAYSAGRFRSDALREIAAIHAAGRIPLLAGGTMLYFRALEQGLAEIGFQLLDLCRHRRLGNVELAGGAGEVAVVLLQFGFEAFEQGEGVGGATGKARKHTVVV